MQPTICKDQMNIEDIWTYSYDPCEDLTPGHLEQLQEESGLGLEIIQEARLFSLKGRFVTEAGLRDEILNRLNLKSYRDDLLIFPYPGHGNTFRVRLDVPEEIKNGEKINYIRYKQPRKQRNYIYSVQPNTSKFPNITFVTEGEKKTLALVQAGCNVMGFGGVWNWRDKSSPSGIIPDLETYDLYGKKVAIIFDSDVVTNVSVQQAEESIVEFCLDRGASEVLRIRIPYVTDQKLGIDDYLKDKDRNDNVMEKLLSNALVERGFVTGAELMKKKLDPSPMLTDFFPSRALILAVGVPGAGKTEFLINQAIEAAGKGKVLYYLNEGGQLDLQARQNAYCKDTEVLNNILWEQKRWLNLSHTKGIDKLERIVQTFKPKIVFIDPGPDAFGEENDASALKEPLGRLYQLTNKYNFCILLSWHSAKAMAFSGVYAFRGSSAIAGKMDLMYVVDNARNKRVLSLEKLRLDCPGLTQGQKWIIDVTNTDDGKEMTFIDKQDAADERYERKKTLLSNALSRFEPEAEYTVREIVATTLEACEYEFKEGTAKNHLTSWTERGYFKQIEAGRGTRAATYLRTDKKADIDV